MERPERPTRHKSNPIAKPKLPVCPTFSSDSDSDHNDDAPQPIDITYYRSQEVSDGEGPSTSGTSQATQSTSEVNVGSGPSERKISLSPAVLPTPSSFTLQPIMKSFLPRPMGMSMSSLEEEPQAQEPSVRSRKRAASSAAASVIFDSVDTLTGSNTNGTERTEECDHQLDSSDRQEFQHNDFVIRPRSFCSIEYCNSNGTRVPYKHKRLNAPIDLTSSIPSSSTASGRTNPGMNNLVPNHIRNEANDSSPFLHRSSPVPLSSFVTPARRDSQPSCSSSILRQFDELCNTSPIVARRRPRIGFNVRFCDSSSRYNDDTTNDEANNVPFITGESSRPSRNTNLDDYCDLVGNFLFNYPPSSLHNSDNTRNVDNTFSLPSRSPFSERNDGETQSSSSVDNNPRPISIPDIVNSFMGHIDNSLNPTNGGVQDMEMDQPNDDVIVVEAPERPPLPDSPGPYMVPSSRSPTPSPPRTIRTPATPTPGTSNMKRSNGDVPMTLQDLNQTLVSLLECPVCLDHATPPIYQCCKGHIVCQSCHPRLNACPICRSRLPGDRNSSMEKVAEKLMYPCKNTLTGCTMMLKLDDKQEHEEGCGFRHYPCIIPSCHWKGYKPELVVHLQSDHPDKLIDGSNKDVQVPLSVPLGGTMFIAHHWIQSAHNEVFNVIFHVDLYKRVMKGCVTYIGSPEKADKFTYQFELKQRTPPYRKLTYSRTTYADTHKPSLQLSMSNDFSINIDMARLYRPEDCPVHAIPVNISINVVPSSGE